MANVKEVMKVTKVLLVDVEGPNGVVHQVLAWAIARTAAHNARLVLCPDPTAPGILPFDFEADPGGPQVLTLVFAHTEYDPGPIMTVCVHAEDNQICENVPRP